MQDKAVALVTGANKGLGLQIVKDLVKHGFVALIGSRNLASGEAAAKSVGADAHAIQIDVTDQISIADAARRIRSEFGRLDVLVNNAAILHTGDPSWSIPEVQASSRPSIASVDEVRAVFETNVFGVIAVTQAMLPLLREAPAARIVNISSSSASLTLSSAPDNPWKGAPSVVYNPSKTALNAITLAFAQELEPLGIKVNAACPGFIATDFNNFQGSRTVEQGAREVIRLALLDGDGPTGGFSSEDGPYPW